MIERLYPFQTTSIISMLEGLHSVQQATQLGAYSVQESAAYQVEIISQVLICRVNAGQPLPSFKFGPSIIWRLNQLYSLPPYERAKQ